MNRILTTSVALCSTSDSLLNIVSVLTACICRDNPLKLKCSCLSNIKTNRRQTVVKSIQLLRHDPFSAFPRCPSACYTSPVLLTDQQIWGLQACHSEISITHAELASGSFNGRRRFNLTTRHREKASGSVESEKDTAVC